jgi:hypothetical protein
MSADPELLHLPLTNEDWAISVRCSVHFWLKCYNQFGRPPRLVPWWRVAVDGDRRDAALFAWCRRHPDATWTDMGVPGKFINVRERPDLSDGWIWAARTLPFGA